MPIYEFRCPRCGKRSEKLCKMGETGETLVCEVCGQSGLQKLVSGFASPGVAGAGPRCSPGCGGNCAGCH